MRLAFEGRESSSERDAERLRVDVRYFDGASHGTQTRTSTSHHLEVTELKAMDTEGDGLADTIQL